MEIATMMSAMICGPAFRIIELSVLTIYLNRTKIPKVNPNLFFFFLKRCNFSSFLTSFGSKRRSLGRYDKGLRHSFILKLTVCNNYWYLVVKLEIEITSNPIQPRCIMNLFKRRQTYLLQQKKTICDTNVYSCCLSSPHGFMFLYQSL